MVARVRTVLYCNHLASGIRYGAEAQPDAG